MKHFDTEPVKVYFTPKEVAKELGVSIGLIFYYSGILKVGTRNERPRKFIRKDIEKMRDHLTN